MSSPSDATKDSPSSPADSEKNNTQTAVDDTTKEEQESLDSSGKDRKAYVYKYHDSILTAEEAAGLDPTEIIRIPGIEPPPEESSPTKCYYEGAEKQLGIEGIVHGRPLAYRRWDGRTMDHIEYKCFECWLMRG